MQRARGSIRGGEQPLSSSFKLPLETDTATMLKKILARLNKKKNQNLVGNPQEEGEEVDILMGEKEMQMPYSDSEEDDLEYLPVIPEPDVPPPKDFFSQLDLSRERQTSL